MAKKSAKSKGYRKQVGKKPYLSKRDIVILCVLVAALAVGAFFLFRYDDGALKVQDGAVVADGDGWLIVDGSNVRGRSRYFKLGEIGDIDGYLRETRSTLTDSNVPEYVFTPEAEDSGIVNITATASHSAASVLAPYAAAALGEIDGTDIGEVQSAELAGQPVEYYIYTVAPAEDAEEAPEDAADAPTAEDAGIEPEGDSPDDADAAAPRFAKSVSAYIDADHDSCIVIHVESRADSEDALLPDEALTAALKQAVAAVALEEGK